MQDVVRRLGYGNMISARAPVISSKMTFFNGLLFYSVFSIVSVLFVGSILIFIFSFGWNGNAESLARSVGM